jgi:hypothetical protein
LAYVLSVQGHIDDAVAVLRTLADTGDEYASERLVDLLVKHGRFNELRDEVHAGTLYAADRLGRVLVAYGGFPA